jgi:hypothetical protein
MADHALLSPTLARFLAHLHRGGAWAYWWTSDEARRDAGGCPLTCSHWWPTTRAPLPLPLDTTRNVYLGVHPCRVRRGDRQRATTATIAAINCLYAEFDAPTRTAKAALLKRVESLVPSPSVIVDSGGGYHAYWLLDEPFVLHGEPERARARQAQYAWVAVTGADPGAKDLARVLRVPGTVNYKAAYAPDFPTVTFVRADVSCVYTLRTLEQAIHAAPVATPQPLPDASVAPSDPERAEQALARLSAARCTEYQDWLHVGMALHAGLGDAGLALWERWSQQSAKYQAGVCAAKWRSFAQRTNGYTLASLFYWADQDAGGTHTARSTAARGTPQSPLTPASLPTLLIWGMHAALCSVTVPMCAMSPSGAGWSGTGGVGRWIAAAR